MSGVSEDDPPELVDIPMAQLTPETLQALVESFVLREGTDYGVTEAPLATKVAQVIRQLQRAEARIVFDPVTESVDIRLALGK
jgi:uncharacterized protein